MAGRRLHMPLRLRKSASSLPSYLHLYIDFRSLISSVTFDHFGEISFIIFFCRETDDKISEFELLKRMLFRGRVRKPEYRFRTTVFLQAR